MSKARYSPALLFVIDGTREAYIGSNLQNIFLRKPVWLFPLLFSVNTKLIYLAAFFFFSYYIYENTKCLL